jgi:hypothetical protein
VEDDAAGGVVDDDAPAQVAPGVRLAAALGADDLDWGDRTPGRQGSQHTAFDVRGAYRSAVGEPHAAAQRERVGPPAVAGPRHRLTGSAGAVIVGTHQTTASFRRQTTSTATA